MSVSHLDLVPRHFSQASTNPFVPDTVAIQPITSTTDTDDLHDANPSHTTLRTRWRGGTRPAGHSVNSECPADAEDSSPLSDTNRTGTGLFTRT